MANIPIEIVLRDPNNPIVPTPDTPGDDPGENTNILVPDTSIGAGYTTKDGNGTNGIFGSSSATVSIVSIVVLALTLGAIITLLIHRYRKRKKAKDGTEECITKLSKKEKLATAVTSTLAVLAAVTLVGNICMTATNAATDDTGATITTPDKIQIVANRYEDVTIVASAKVISYASTDTTFGYKIFMSMAGDNANLYLDGDEASEYYFAPTTKIGLGTNSWGYSFSSDGEDGYSAMPLAGDPLMAQQTTEAVEGEEFTVYYTMKADKDMPYGVYSGEITYDIEGYNGFPTSLTAMQGMTSEICDAVYTPSDTETVVPSTTLADTRDQKTYEIAKLADGKCWMVQNLDLELSTEKTLTPADTNITADWTPTNSTISFTGTSVPGWQHSDTVPYSADPGELYIYSSGTIDDDGQYTSLEACQAVHPDCSMKNHAGNYYNWSAVVANNDTSSMTEQFSDALDSICPAGWRLSTGPDVNDINYSDMGNLTANYDNITEKPINEGCGGFCNYYNYVEGGFNTIRTAPLWLVRFGCVSDGSLGDAGNFGSYWTSTVDNGGGAYRLSFGSSGMYPASGSSRGRGYSVRCVAQ